MWLQNSLTTSVNYLIMDMPTFLKCNKYFLSLTCNGLQLYVCFFFAFYGSTFKICSRWYIEDSLNVLERRQTVGLFKQLSDVNRWCKKTDFIQLRQSLNWLQLTALSAIWVQLLISEWVFLPITPAWPILTHSSLSRCSSLSFYHHLLKDCSDELPHGTAQWSIHDCHPS